MNSQFNETLFMYLFILHTEAALNLFINSNAQELLKEMKPALRSKLTLVLRNFIDKLFEKIPLEQFLVWKKEVYAISYW